MSFGQKKLQVKLIRHTVGKGKITARWGRDGRVIEWKDVKGKKHSGTRVASRSHK